MVRADGFRAPGFSVEKKRFLEEQTGLENELGYRKMVL